MIHIHPRSCVLHVIHLCFSSVHRSGADASYTLLAISRLRLGVFFLNPDPKPKRTTNPTPKPVAETLARRRRRSPELEALVSPVEQRHAAVPAASLAVERLAIRERVEAHLHAPQLVRQQEALRVGRRGALLRQQLVVVHVRLDLDDLEVVVEAAAVALLEQDARRPHRVLRAELHKGGEAGLVAGQHRLEIPALCELPSLPGEAARVGLAGVAIRRRRAHAQCVAEGSGAAAPSSGVTSAQVLSTQRSADAAGKAAAMLGCTGSGNVFFASRARTFSATQRWRRRSATASAIPSAVTVSEGRAALANGSASRPQR
eukprot:CAMPEP_0118856786 /NCGR_PEP_ID=MMETSP1163-20130328/4131_1 /TAXON_ID=124430 /ORGANISM="Phaeomonas parva, Strain CCMP2877" /LENGTH=315 /DNA_ID=CAMNT_0006789961 /DNA_START=1666 /DNA_END=2611 /DNA_ORIENTATION=+